MREIGPAGHEPVYRHVVRYHETDSQGVLFNARYLELFDVALTELFRSLGWPYPQLVEAGLDPVLVRAEVDFTRPAVFDDTLDVRATCTAIGRSSFTLTFSVSKDGEDVEVSRASITYVNVDPETGRSRPVPDAVRAALGALGGEG